MKQRGWIDVALALSTGLAIVGAVWVVWNGIFAEPKRPSALAGYASPVPGQLTFREEPLTLTWHRSPPPTEILRVTPRDELFVKGKRIGVFPGLYKDAAKNPLLRCGE